MSTETFVAQLGFNRWALTANVGDLSHEESVVCPRPAGNSVNWTVGHLVATRNRLLQGIGASPVWGEDDDAPYGTASEPWRDGSRAKPFPEVLAAFERSQEAVAQALGRLSAEDLAGSAPFSPGGRENETLGSLLTSFCCHEAYHVGQTGLLRRLLGRPGKLG